MLLSAVDGIDHYKVGKHLIVHHLMRGIYNQNPPREKYSYLVILREMCDINIVINYLELLGSNVNLNLNVLTYKLVRLLALALLFMISDFEAIDYLSCSFSSQEVRFSLKFLRKSQRTRALKSFSLERLIPPSNLCPVNCT